MLEHVGSARLCIILVVIRCTCTVVHAHGLHVLHGLHKLIGATPGLHESTGAAQGLHQSTGATYGLHESTGAFRFPESHQGFGRWCTRTGCTS